MTKFIDLGLAEPILKAVQSEGYETPTPIQAQAIPHALSGRDMVGIAQTGTGKTAAFVLPMLDKLSRDKRPARPKTCKALILAPTRELAAQILESVRLYGKNTRPSHTLVIGGVKGGPQIKAMARGLDVIVATPGRLLDQMSINAIRLEDTQYVVLDEADQMMDLGFLPTIRRIMAKLPENKQALLFSATMPKQIRALANDFLNDPQEVTVSAPSKPVDRIIQKVMLVEQSDKRKVLTEVIKATPAHRTIVFTRTKRGADRVTKHLNDAHILSEAIHGDKSQGQREKALKAFKAGRINVLVATDIAARGIDIDGVEHVVNFELPNVPESYVHRIGRTARAGAEGQATSLCDSTEYGLLKDIEKLIGRRLVEGEERARAIPERQLASKPLYAKSGERNGQKKPRPHGQSHSSDKDRWGNKPKSRFSGEPRKDGEDRRGGKPARAPYRHEGQKPVAGGGESVYSLSALMDEGQKAGGQKRRPRRRNPNSKAA